MSTEVSLEDAENLKDSNGSSLMEAVQYFLKISAGQPYALKFIRFHCSSRIQRIYLNAIGHLNVRYLNYLNLKSKIITN
jgi:hypothetical protein